MEDDEGIKDAKMVIKKVNELKDDFNALGSDCFNHCSEEKICCLASAVSSMPRSGTTVMNRQKLKENGCTSLYIVLQGCTWLYKVAHGCSFSSIVLQGCTQLYKVVHGCTIHPRTHDALS